MHPGARGQIHIDAKILLRAAAVGHIEANMNPGIVAVGHIVEAPNGSIFTNTGRAVLPQLLAFCRRRTILGSER
jgi:hypothetical protein